MAVVILNQMCLRTVHCNWIRRHALRV